MTKSIKQNFIVVIIISFLFYSAPLALDYIFHFTDEKYYTDAVIQMLEKNDYLTPYKADGSYRFLKPIITYWVLISSYSILGISAFSSRVLFWLAGALLVYIVYRMSNSLFKNRKIAIISSLIASTNPLILLSASRSIPDILLTLFLTISAYGFLKILTSEIPAKKYYWMAYLGGALAFETKGLPAVAYVSISFLFILLNPWKRKSLKTVLEPYSVITSILVASSWFVIMYFTHKNVFIDSFFEDQVGMRVASRHLKIIYHGFLGFANIILFLLPWILIPFIYFKEVKIIIQNLEQREKSIFGFIGGWVILTIIMTAAVSFFYNRYVLPVLPLMSILIGYLLYNLSSKKILKPISIIFFVLNIFVLTVAVWLSFKVGYNWRSIIGIVITTLMLIIIFKTAENNVIAEMPLAHLILLLFFNVFTFLSGLLMPMPPVQIIETLYENGVDENTGIYVYGNIRMASTLRVESGGKLNIISKDKDYTLPTNENNHVVVIESKEMNKLNLDNYEIKAGSEEISKLKADEFKGFLYDNIKKLKESGNTYFIAIPKVDTN